MSKSRQSDIFDDRYLARALAVDYVDGERLPPHRHPWAQLVYAESGVMQLDTDLAAWLVPTTRAIWIPPGVTHSIRMRGDVSMRTLYITRSSSTWPDECQAMEVTHLLRELILYLVRIDRLDPANEKHTRLVGLLSDLLAECRQVPLVLPLPADSRARLLADRILAAPDNRGSLAALSQQAGASVRTLQRIFKKEVGMPLELWRLRARMQQAVVMLSTGASVTETAFAAGYASQSAFATAFKRVFSVCPSHYRRQLLPR